MTDVFGFDIFDLDSPAPRKTLFTENRAVAAERLAALRAYSHRQERSQQKTPGWSEIGGPACALQYKLMGQPVTNHDTQVLAALRGTAVHKVLEEAVPAYEMAQGREAGISEGLVSFAGIPGHYDRFEPGVVEDYKTKDKDGMARVRQYGPPDSYIAQAHGYAAGLIEAGEDVHTLRWTFVSVSTPDDVYVVEMPFDPDYLEGVLLRYEQLKADAEAGVKPEPLKDRASWCRPFCPYFDPTGEVGCPGRQGKAAGLEAEVPGATLAPVVAAASDYLRGKDLEEQGKTLRLAAREALVGVRGVAGDYLVSWSCPEPKEVPDKEAALGLLKENGIDLPTVVKTASPSISVKTVAS